MRFVFAVHRSVYERVRAISRFVRVTQCYRAGNKTKPIISALVFYKCRNNILKKPTNLRGLLRWNDMMNIPEDESRTRSLLETSGQVTFFPVEIVWQKKKKTGFTCGNRI